MRVLLKGQGTPIPEIALPDSNIDPSLPSTTFTYTDNADFTVGVYRGLGFTHYEAWCIGGSGGRGGDGSNEVDKVFNHTRHPVPQDVWDFWLHKIRVTDYRTRSGEWDHVYAWGDGAGLMTMPQHEEYINPTHELDFYDLTSMSLKAPILPRGGGGGGGGLHMVSGSLADLPSSVPVVVGSAGVDAALGQVRQNGVWTPDGYFGSVTVPPGYPAHPPEPSNWDHTQPPFLTYLDQLTNWFWVYTYTNPTPGISFAMPLSGGDGGPSSFGAVGKGSGGKGGQPGKIWTAGNFVDNGNGGDGGVGGSIVVGGGGTGSSAVGVNGSDGLWLPETGIGKGGGGGKGGSPASSGGKGSYNFGDTTVYGPGQPPQSFVPGGGGGAKINKLSGYGSKASGFNPNGVVIIRITKLV